MNNRENYKKAIDQIHVDSNLKEKVLEKAKENNKSKKTIYYFRYVVSLATIAVVAVVGISFANKPKEEVLKAEEHIIEEEKISALENVSIKRFNSVDELREVLEKYEDEAKATYRDLYGFDITKGELSTNTESAKEVFDSASSQEKLNYSKTNNQVESVDEADFVKTDGKYIYYCKGSKIFIVDKDLNLKATIKEENFSPSNIFVNGNKLVTFGNFYSRNLVYNDVARTETNSILKEDIDTYIRRKTLVKVYNLDDIENPQLVREISVDGNYRDARMIDDNIYFVTNYCFQYYKSLREMTDKELLPEYQDSSITKDTKTIEARNIAYFEDSENYEYSLIAGFNLNSNKEVNIEAFFGFGNNFYVSENNMYVVCTRYTNFYASESVTKIYKFELKQASIIAKASCEIDGYVGNQFALDEYDGNLRVATTVNDYDNIESSKVYAKLTIFNEKLEKIGGIDNLVEDERIYSVRFIGKVGYIVTFEQVDPLWVIDLSDPTNPVVKGQLEIPGYSSYLHPYDETHIIGIGYDVKDNGYGGVTNDRIKLSMFDVSDLENPKELFKINFNKNRNDGENAYASIMYEHKALFFNKEKNLIGFPINTWNRKLSKNRTGVILYRIDLENNEFEEIQLLLKENKYGAERELYIGEDMYILYGDLIEKYDLNTFENKGSIKLDVSYNWVELD